MTKSAGCAEVVEVERLLGEEHRGFGAAQRFQLGRCAGRVGGHDDEPDGYGTGRDRAAEIRGREERVLADEAVPVGRDRRRSGSVERSRLPRPRSRSASDRGGPRARVPSIAQTSSVR